MEPKLARIWCGVWVYVHVLKRSCLFLMLTSIPPSLAVMPARTVLFDVKANPVHNFGSLPRNFLSYQPQGRLFILAGFGNLTGTVDIHDLRTRKLVCQFQAPNSTTCEWSPCGRYILTGTLSPRLRVDNGLKVWWCSGGLMHVQPIEELYQVCEGVQMET